MTKSKVDAPSTARVAENLHGAVDAAAAKVGGAEENLRERADKVQQSAEHATARTKEVAESVADYTRDHPLAAVGIAFAAGALLATLMRR